MNALSLRLRLWGLLIALAAWSNSAWGADPKVQVVSPRDGSRITQEQNTIVVSGKVASQTSRSANADILLVIDVSGSTSVYAGVDLGDGAQLPDNCGSSSFPRPQISIGGFGFGQPPPRNLRNSILAAEVAAARRLLMQLNSETTRVGVITFSHGARLLQPLTHDYEHGRRNSRGNFRAVGIRKERKKNRCGEGRISSYRWVSDLAHRRRETDGPRGCQSGDKCRATGGQGRR